MSVHSIDHRYHFGARPVRSLWESLKRGWFRRCPACGEGRIFNGYLSVNKACPECGLVLENHRADDAPPYFTIMIVGHVVIPALLMYDRLVAPQLWELLVVGSLLTLLSSLYLLPRIKGSLIGLQWAKRMHGFDNQPDEPDIATASKG